MVPKANLLILRQTKTDQIMKNIQRSLLGLLATAFILSGCSNIDIVKRRHMPGYHVEVNKKSKYEKPAKDDAQMARAEKQMENVPSREASLKTVDTEEEILTASAAPLSPEIDRAERKANRKEAMDRATEKTMTTFQHELAVTKKALKPAVNTNTHWMAWVAFGAGIGSAAFGLLGLIVAFFGIGLWAVALTFGVAAIVFAIIHSKNNYQGAAFRRIGLILGIVGASLGIIGMMIWILRLAGVFIL